MTKLNFCTTDDPEANVFQKYPVVWWTDLMLISILLLCIWAYCVQQYGIAGWLVSLCLSNSKIALVIGTLGIVLIIVLACVWLARETSIQRK